MRGYGRNTCWYCGGFLVWDNDFDLDDVYPGEQGTITYLHCSECDAEVTYVSRDDYDEGDEE